MEEENEQKNKKQGPPSLLDDEDLFEEPPVPSITIIKENENQETQEQVLQPPVGQGNQQLLYDQQPQEREKIVEEGIYVSVGSDHMLGGEDSYTEREHMDRQTGRYIKGDRVFVPLDGNTTVKKALDAAMTALDPTQRRSLEAIMNSRDFEVRSGDKQVTLTEPLEKLAKLKVTRDGVGYKEVSLLLSQEDSGGYLDVI